MTKHKKISLILSVLVCVISIVVMFVALMQVQKQEILPFISPPFETDVQQGIPKVPNGLGWGKIDAQVYEASVCGIIVLNNKTADVWFTNWESNSVWIKLRVLDSTGNVLGETGLIKPGEYVQSITFRKMPKVGEVISLKLMAYEPQTYCSAGSVMLTTTVTGGDK